jgi:hypothetical protein
LLQQARGDVFAGVTECAGNDMELGHFSLRYYAER